MSRFVEYTQLLQGLEDYQDFLLKNSGLPSPRGIIDLAMAFCKVGSQADFERLLEEKPPLKAGFAVKIKMYAGL